MDMLKKFFPIAFLPKADVASLVINVLIQLVVGVVIGWVIGLFVPLFIIGMVFALAGTLLELYIFASIVIAFLDYFKILK